MVAERDGAHGHREANRQPIFILGMLPRSGTNHLWDLVALHPDVEPLPAIYEDHLVRWSQHLAAYVDDVTGEWSPEWEVPPSERAALLRSIGDGIVDWLAGHAAHRRIVTKMPSVEGAQRFFELFGDAPLLLLVRDGRSVAESGVATFGWTHERAFRRWRRAADVVLRLGAQHGDRRSMSIVRYEDLVERPAVTMRAVCEAAGLDADRYPHDQVHAAPVRGSSTLRQDSGTVHWEPTARTSDFNPLERWRTWPDHLHRRFARIAGDQQRALGYDLLDVGGSDSVAERVLDVRDLLTDAVYRQLRGRAARIGRAIRRTEGPI